MKKATTDNPSAETPAPAIPPGTEADVTLKYKTRVDPNQAGARNDLSDLQQYANELEAETLPLDELGTFCATWANYGGYNLNIVRLPDPPERRLIGQTYVRPCFNMEQLGATSFDPTNLIASLQYFNQGSGGVFRLWLTDHNGEMIPGAHVQRVAIADPPRGHNSQQQQGQQQPAQQFQPQPQPQPREREKSESERQLESVKEQLFTTALQRALNPPQQQQQPGQATPALPADQQAMLYLLGNSELVPNLVKQMTALATQTANAGQSASWRDRAVDAAVEVATTNPAVIERLGGIVERIAQRLLPDPRLDGQQPQPQQFQPVYAPAPQPQAEAQPLPESPDPGDDLGSDDDTMDIIDNLTALLNSDKPLALSDPLFKQMQQAYPLKFKFAIKMIIASDLDTIINWIKLTGGAPYVILLEGHGGAYVIERMAELQKLIIAGDKAAREKNANTQTSNEQAPGAPEVKPEG